ncbi:hypothetical protein AB0M87_04590 [Streptomyces sp. NPDC051320]|uniref:hypothetical protein n=1 Tax=Streptomyces sp. NPDC051320 TaxID=3154644 RepID=UPI003449EE5D
MQKPDTVTIPTATAAAFTESWGTLLANRVGPLLTCGEVEDVAELLRALGQEPLAGVWIAEHATADDKEDLHWLGTAHATEPTPAQP